LVIIHGTLGRRSGEKINENQKIPGSLLSNRLKKLYDADP
jgi:hypothetical protein